MKMTLLYEQELKTFRKLRNVLEHSGISFYFMYKSNWVCSEPTLEHASGSPFKNRTFYNLECSSKFFNKLKTCCSVLRTVLQAEELTDCAIGSPCLRFRLNGRRVLRKHCILGRILTQLRSLKLTLTPCKLSNNVLWYDRW